MSGAQEFYCFQQHYNVAQPLNYASLKAVHCHIEADGSTAPLLHHKKIYIILKKKIILYRHNEVAKKMNNSILKYWNKWHFRI